MPEIAGHPSPHPNGERRMLDREERDVGAMVADIAAELRMGFEIVARIDRPAASLFGSARTSRRPLVRVAWPSAPGSPRRGGRSSPEAAPA